MRYARSAPLAELTSNIIAKSSKVLRRDNGLTRPQVMQRHPADQSYEMRRTFVSMAQDLPDGKLKLLVGHSRNMDTRGVYGHQRTGDAQATAKDLTNLFNEVLMPENQDDGQHDHHFFIYYES
jgi:hypothetical protein